MVVELFRSIINPDTAIERPTVDGRVILKETSEESKIKKLTVQKVPQDCFIFTLDHQPEGVRDSQKKKRYYKQLSLYFNASHPIINKSCDYVFVFEDSDNTKILLLELKSENPKGADVQLRNSELFIHYILSILKEHYNADLSKVTIKKAVTTTTARKTGVHPRSYSKSSDIVLLPLSVKGGGKEAVTYLKALWGGK